MSVIVPLLHRKAWLASVLDWPKPVTCPVLLRAVARICGPPRLPRSVGVPLCHSTTYCLLVVLLVASVQPPMTSPLLLSGPPLQLSPLGLGSWVNMPLLSMQACWQPPEIWPESLMPDAFQLPMSVIDFPFQRNASPPVVVSAWPTISPDRLIATPLLKCPPSVPRSVRVPLLHRNAW